MFALGPSPETPQSWLTKAATGVERPGSENRLWNTSVFAAARCGVAAAKALVMPAVSGTAAAAVLAGSGIGIPRGIAIGTVVETAIGITILGVARLDVAAFESATLGAVVACATLVPLTGRSRAATS